jgi:Bacterial membrane protein YfhO
MGAAETPDAGLTGAGGTGVATEPPILSPPPAPPTPEADLGPAPGAALWNRLGPWAVVALALAWGLKHLWPETTAVPYLDDSSLHEQMVRFAADRIKAGHLPLTSWWPYLGLGSPQFLHYQSLPAMVDGLIGTVFDPDTVFRWSLYLLLALWPLVIYWSARLFGLSRWTAASAAAVSPFLMSVPGIGYETIAYVWAGFGVVTQLWASWTLPLAWGFSFRAMSNRRAILPAVVFVALTVALHYETGYLAFVPLLLWPFLVPSDLRRRIVRSAIVAVSAALVAAWVIYPVLAQSHWAAKNQVLGQTPLENGYGAGTIMRWLVGGNLLDNGRFAVVTIFMAIGLGVCLYTWRRHVAGRALVTIWAVALLMTFGRTTFGALYDIVPGSSDVFIRRFQMGVQLSSILVAGIGLVATGQLVRLCVQTAFPEARRWLATNRWAAPVVAVTCVLSLLLVLYPAWSELDTYDAHNATNIALQAADDAQSEGQLNQVLSYVVKHPHGRVYAGDPTNWGMNFLIGAVPVFKYLENQDIDEVGYTLRTASLMTDPEYHFDQDNPGDYTLFGIGYLVLPRGDDPPVPAGLISCAGIYCLWSLPGAGYVHVYDTTGVLTATRADVGTQSVPLLESSLPSENRALTVAFNGHPAAALTAADPTDLRGEPGQVVHERADLVAGHVSATVHTQRRSVVVLSASYAPGWTATVDGHPAPTEMIAPALVGVAVGPGVHRVTFRYDGFASYGALWILAAVVLIALTVGPWVWTRARRNTPAAAEGLT